MATIPVYGVMDFLAGFVLPAAPPAVPVENAMYGAGGHVYLYQSGQWVDITGGGGGGGAPARYVHTQAILASTWTVTHNLGAHPAVAVEDAVGSVIYGTIRYLDDNTLTISFRSTCTGRASLI